MTQYNYETVKAGGGVVFRINNDDPEILLIHRRGVWDLPKGKLDPGESIQHCAAREVAEETGIGFPMIVGDLGETIHYYQEEGKDIEKQTFWYIMVTGNEQAQPQEEEQIAEVKWVVLSSAMEQVGFENLKEVLLRFKTWFTK